MKANVPDARAVADSDAVGTYATETQVQAAIANLTEADHAKLYLIARSFCKSRKFSQGVMEPGELISEAIYRTLTLAKKWNTSVTIIKHLDRAMENISGHLAKERSRIVPFPGQGAEEPEGDEDTSDKNSAIAVNESEEREKCETLLKSIFEEDKEAETLFVMKTEGFSPSEIQTHMRVSTQRYEALTRRVHRKITAFLKH